MPEFSLPTTQEVIDRNLASLESNLNQTSPLADKAFLRVLATVEGGNYTELNRYALNLIEQVLALTATGEDLDRIGNNYGVTRTPAQPTILECRIFGSDSLTLPADTLFVGEPNDIRYLTNEDANGGTSPYTFLCTAQTAGTVGNLIAFQDSLIIGSPVPGFESTAVVIETDPTVNPDLQLGIDKESDESYRRRVLNEIRTVGGGSNGVDHRTWAEETPGVERAYPYSSAPIYPIPDFLDGNCEDPTTGAWKPANGAVLSKVTTSPHGGIRALRVTSSATAFPTAYQDALQTGYKYRLTGYARSDGSSQPLILNAWAPVTIPLWLGSDSTSWQYFDITFIAKDITIEFSVVTGPTPGIYCDFDDMTITRQLLPGDRSVFIECDSSIDPDGIPPQSILDDTREYIKYDQDTGEGRPALGLTDENLYVEPIRRTVIFVEVRGLDVPSEVEAQVKADINIAVDQYLRSVVPFVDGVDPIITRNDKITDLTLSNVIQDILNPVGGSAAGIGLGTEPALFVGSYQLGMDEMTKLDPGGVSFVT